MSSASWNNSPTPSAPADAGTASCAAVHCQSVGRDPSAWTRGSFSNSGCSSRNASCFDGGKARPSSCKVRSLSCAYLTCRCALAHIFRRRVASASPMSSVSTQGKTVRPSSTALGNTPPTPARFSSSPAFPLRYTSTVRRCLGLSRPSKCNRPVRFNREPRVQGSHRVTTGGAAADSGNRAHAAADCTRARAAAQPGSAAAAASPSGGG
mmetsp:Transcript_65438/g.189604  ORF Transcript_65438/g.189604 Transcript_65438/m.189604 type:complete len:209 (-) Transcript_65438:280-906(-)